MTKGMEKKQNKYKYRYKYKSLQIRKQIGRHTTAVEGGWYKYVVPSTSQISLRKRGAFYVLEFLALFSHMMRTLRMSTAVVLVALLAAVIEFVWVALFAASVAVDFVCFWFVKALCED